MIQVQAPSFPERERLIEELDRTLGGQEFALKRHLVGYEIINSQRKLVHIIKSASDMQKELLWWRMTDESCRALPLEVLNALHAPAPGQKHPHQPSRTGYMCTLVRPLSPGQSTRNDRNVGILIEPYWYGDNNKYVLVEVGCTHDITLTNIGRCLNVYSCNKCGYESMVDSSD